MIHLTIDGKSVEVPEKTTVLKAAKMAGVTVPTLCEHPALKPYGSCRLCVVEIEGFRTLQASCTLPASEGMVVKTNTPKLRASRQFILSMLFSERNHFCMYCQKTNGDCELQNAAYKEGMDHWPVQPNWNPFPVDATHPYYVLDNNRCILCRRCVRACGELVGNFTLGIENRGSSCILIADTGVPLGESSCVKCGTCAQVCPTGAIIDRQSAYLGKDARAEHFQTLCVGCSVGCGVELVVKDNRVLHVDGDFEASLNNGVLCEQGRYQSLDGKKDRITSPMVRRNGKLVAATWEEAIAAAGEAIKAQAGNPAGVAALISTRLPAEALYSFKSIFADGLKAAVVTGVEEAITTGVQKAFPGQAKALNGKLDQLKAADCVVAVGVDLVKSHQVAGFFVKRNLPLGTRLIVVDPYTNRMSDIADYNLKIKPGSDADLFLGIMSAIRSLGMDKGSLQPGLDLSKYTPEAVAKTTGIPAETLLEISREIAAAQKPVFVYGRGLTAGNDPKALEALLALGKLVNAPDLVSTKGKANSLAAHYYGLDQAFEPKGAQAAYVALGDDMPVDRLLNSLADVPFLAVQASYASELTDRANVVLPVETWTEQEGHFVNMEGRVQVAYKAITAPAGVLSNTAVLKELAKCLGVTVNGDWREGLPTR